MDIEINKDSNKAYEQGWRDALRFLDRKVSKYRDQYLMPSIKKDQEQLQEGNAILNLIDTASDIQAATAWLQDNLTYSE